MSYLIKKDSKTNTITYMNYNLEGYKFTPKSKKSATLQVNQIVVMNPQMIDKILTIKFNSMFKNLMTFISQFLCETSDDSSANGSYALSEIDRLKSIINNKYQKYIAIEKQNLFLDKLNFLENQLKLNMLQNIQINESLMEENTVGRGR